MATKHGLGRAKFRVGQVVRISQPSWVKILKRNKPHLYLGKWYRSYKIDGLADPGDYAENDMRPLTKRERGR